MRTPLAPLIRRDKEGSLSGGDRERFISGDRVYPYHVGEGVFIIKVVEKRVPFNMGNKIETLLWCRIFKSNTTKKLFVYLLHQNSKQYKTTKEKFKQNNIYLFFKIFFCIIKNNKLNTKIYKTIVV